MHNLIVRGTCISHEESTSNKTYQSVIKYSRVLEGLIRQTGIHAAGVVIGPGDLSDYVPLAIQQRDGQQSVLVQYEGKWLDDLKLLNQLPDNGLTNEKKITF